MTVIQKVLTFIKKTKGDVKKKGILWKFSGEWMSGSESVPFNVERVWKMAHEIERIFIQMPRVGMIVMPGGGNIYRGEMKKDFRLDKTSSAFSDKIGIRATEINALLLGAMLVEDLGEEHVAIFVSSDPDPSLVYSYEKVSKALKQGKLVVLGGGTGNPGTSTDYAAANRATLFDRGCIIMAKNGVDGVYTDDPRKKKAKKVQKYATASYSTAFNKGVMDGTAVGQARDNGGIPLYVYDADNGDSLLEFLDEDATLSGTLIGNCPTTFASAD